MGLGTPIATPPIRRGTSRPFQRAIENLSTTSWGFKTFTLKISMVMVYGYGYGYLDQNAEFLRQPTRNRNKFGHPFVSGPPNMSKYALFP